MPLIETLTLNVRSSAVDDPLSCDRPGWSGRVGRVVYPSFGFGSRLTVVSAVRFGTDLQSITELVSTIVTSAPWWHARAW
jgi:hypothetical protein